MGKTVLKLSLLKVYPFPLKSIFIRGQSNLTQFSLLKMYSSLLKHRPQVHCFILQWKWQSSKPRCYPVGRVKTQRAVFECTTPPQSGRGNAVQESTIVGLLLSSLCYCGLSKPAISDLLLQSPVTKYINILMLFDIDTKIKLSQY